MFYKIVLKFVLHFWNPQRPYNAVLHSVFSDPVSPYPKFVQTALDCIIMEVTGAQKDCQLALQNGERKQVKKFIFHLVY